MLPEDLPPDVLAAAAAGHDDAWREIVARIGPAILAYARAQGAGDPEDTLGEVLIELVRSIGRFEGDLGGLRALAIRIAHSRIVDERRRRARRPETPTAAPPERPTPDDPAAELAGADWVREALAGLGPEHRDIVLLRVIAGLSVDETARIVGKRPGAVRTAQHRALSRLRDGLVREP